MIKTELCLKIDPTFEDAITMCVSVTKYDKSSK